MFTLLFLGLGKYEACRRGLDFLYAPARYHPRKNSRRKQHQ